MKARPKRQQPQSDVRRIRRKLQRLDRCAPGYQRERSHLLEDMQLAKQQMQRTRPAGTGGSRRPTSRRPARKKARKASAAQAPSAGKSGKQPLSKLLSPKNLQQTLKTVGSLRTRVKNWLQYLQQADQLLDTIFVTSSSLKESGVMDKLIKNRGKNLTTDDFTNVLMALMNTPVGSQLLKSIGSGSGETSSETPAGK